MMTFEEKMENINRGITLEWASAKLDTFRNRCSRFKLDNPSLSTEMVDKLFKHRLAISRKKAELNSYSRAELKEIIAKYAKTTDKLLKEANVLLSIQSTKNR